MSELLTSPHVTMQVLDRFGIRARKRYGQNFLIDASVIDRAVLASGIGKEDTVLEIGPGIGTMTQILSLAAGKVVAVEIDEGLKEVLAYTLDACENVTILWQDILKTDLQAVKRDYAGGRKMKVVANLPYYITTPILLALLKEKDCFESITVMVQKEVAQRMCACQDDKEYGALSLAVRYYSEPEVVANAAPHCFIPRPSVDSTVLCLHVRENPPVEADEQHLFAVIRAAFNQRRKTVANALAHGMPGVARQDVEEALVSMELPSDIRGEKLSLSQFAALSEKLRTRSGE